MKFLVEVSKQMDETCSYGGMYVLDTAWTSDEKEDCVRWLPYKIRFSCQGMNYGYSVAYKTQERRDEVYEQFKDWMAEIYKCSINKYYLKIFADMGGDIIFRFPEE